MDSDVNKPVMIQLMHRASPGATEALRFGLKFHAEELEDLLHLIQHAKHLLETEFVKEPKGFRTRHVFF